MSEPTTMHNMRTHVVCRLPGAAAGRPREHETRESQGRANSNLYRSLVTVAALITAGQPEQMTFHLNRAMDNGLTQEEAGAMLSHLAFYAGWPKVFSAMPVARQVFESRAD